MDYIINPWWFYLVQVLDTAKILLLFIGIFPFGIGAALWFYKREDMYDACDEDDCRRYYSCKGSYNRDKKQLKLYKYAAIIGAVMISISILLPTEETLIKMQVAKFGTYPNAEKVLEVIDDKTDALIDAIGSNKED